MMSSRRSNLRNFRVEKTTNAGLWLQKFLFTQEKNQDNTKKSAKQNLVDEVSGIEVPEIYEYFYQNVWTKSLEKAEKRFIEISGRMIVGLGSESVLETSITLHRTYGVPFITGSALKGLAASYAHRFMGEDWKKETTDKTTKQKKAIGKAHELMFGSQDSAGFVIFHDALYVPNSYSRKPQNPLEPDILTVHHQKYYQGEGDAPADWDSPVPIPLLSAQGRYLLAVSANSNNAEFDKKMTKLAIEILELALRDEGIGAKTSSGYGRAVLNTIEATVINRHSSENSKSTNISPIQKEPELTAKQRQAIQAQSDERRFQSIKAELEQIGGFDKPSKNKLKDIHKRIRKIEKPELKRNGAELFIEKVKQISGKEARELKATYPWFEAISIFVE